MKQHNPSCYNDWKILWYGQTDLEPWDLSGTEQTEFNEHFPVCGTPIITIKGGVKDDRPSLPSCI